MPTPSPLLVQDFVNCADLTEGNFEDAVGYFEPDDGGEGRFLVIRAVRADTGAVRVPDFGLWFRTGSTMPVESGESGSVPLLLERVLVDGAGGTSIVEERPSSDLSSDAPSGLTPVCTVQANAAWWGATGIMVDNAPLTVLDATGRVLDLSPDIEPEAVMIRAAAAGAYPFLRDGVFLTDDERTASPPLPPDVAAMLADHAGIQSAIERVRFDLGGSRTVLLPNRDYNLNRRVVVRRRTDLTAEPGARLVLGVAFAPQNYGLFFAPVYGPVEGDVQFEDERHILAEAVPGVVFHDTAGPGAIVIYGVPEAAVGMGGLATDDRVWIRRGRSPSDSVEAQWTGFRTVTEVGTDEGGPYVRLDEKLPEALLTTMTLTVASIIPDSNLPGAPIEATLADPLTMMLKRHNPNPTTGGGAVTRTVLRWTWTEGENEVVHEATTFVTGQLNPVSTFWPIGSLGLRVQSEASGLLPPVGATAVWGDESWLFRVVAEPAGSTVTGTLSVGATTAIQPRRSPAVGAYGTGAVTFDRVEATDMRRALLLSYTEGYTVDEAVLANPFLDLSSPSQKNQPVLVLDFQATRDTTVTDAWVTGNAPSFASRGTAVQFENAVDTHIAGTLTIEASPNEEAIRSLVISTYEAQDTTIERLLVVPGPPPPLLPASAQPFQLFSTSGVPRTGQETSLDVGTLELRIDNIASVKPYFVSERLIYQSTPLDINFDAGPPRLFGGTVVEVGLADPGPQSAILKVQGFPRRLSLLATGTAGLRTDARKTRLLFYRRKHVVDLTHLIAGREDEWVDLRPALDPAADRALQLYAGRAFNIIGYLIISRDPQWSDAPLSVDVSGEIFADASASQFAPAEPVVWEAAFSGDAHAGQTTPVVLEPAGGGQPAGVVTVPQGGPRSGVTVRVSFATAGGAVAHVTAGSCSVVVQRGTRSVPVDPADPPGPLEWEAVGGLVANATTNGAGTGGVGFDTQSGFIGATWRAVLPNDRTAEDFRVRLTTTSDFALAPVEPGSVAKVHVGVIFASDAPPFAD